MQPTSKHIPSSFESSAQNGLDPARILDLPDTKQDVYIKEMPNRT